MSHARWLIALFCLAWTSRLLAYPPQPTGEPPMAPVSPTGEADQTGYLRWLLETRNDWSQWVADTGARLDGFFAGKPLENHSNASFVKVRLGPTFEKSGTLSFDPTIQFRLSLPLTEDKYRFILENDPDEGKTLGEKTEERITGGDTKTRNDTTGAFRVVNELREGWKLQHDIGVKLRLPPDPFVRSRATNRFELNENWTLGVKSSVYYFLKKDLGASLLTHFDRPITPSLFFRQSLETQWLRDEDKFEHAITTNLFYEIDNTRIIRYRIGMLAESKPEAHVTNYYYEMTYREKLYKDWLFYELIPLLNFPRSDGYELSPSFTIKLEVIFAGE